MKLIKLTSLGLAIILLQSCGGWGGYIHKSDRFKYVMAFPIGWEVWDRSDDSRDIIVASNTNNPNSEITVLAIPVAPDLNPHEVYTTFLEGGQDVALYEEFRVGVQGTVHAKNAEGRSLHVEYEKGGQKMKGFRTKFLGFRFTLEIQASAPEDDFVLLEPEFRKMISVLEFKK